MGYKGVHFKFNLNPTEQNDVYGVIRNNLEESKPQIKPYNDTTEKYYDNKVGAHFPFDDMFKKLQRVQRHRVLMEGERNMDFGKRLLNQIKIIQEEEDDALSSISSIRRQSNIKVRKYRPKLNQTTVKKDPPPIVQKTESIALPLNQSHLKQFKSSKKSGGGNHSQLRMSDGFTKSTLSSSTNNKEEIDIWLNKQCKTFFKVRKRIQDLTLKDKNEKQTLDYFQRQANIRKRVYSKDLNFQANRKLLDENSLNKH
ncbi:UNKNOWN [Stylonychia lemnae]|uniref:Uncharacterized protein n=1 Tax=Stylonychia lemnae TaxID=5949 RepID=A0A077ZUZ3_STYLE|nr:UNKNOWN [Stylonychia lemnae]|eukprot:CDW73715.1 UNKNOWN [Stylonychia lemnae]